MSVIHLKRIVEKKLSIPPHQQKLVLKDDIILEDWNGDGRFKEKLLTDYPSFCDGSKLYIVQLTGGIKVNVTKSSNRYSRDTISIHDPSVWTLNKLYSVMKSLHSSSSKLVYLYIRETQSTPKSFTPSDNPVSSIDWITDNCTLTLDCKE